MSAPYAHPSLAPILAANPARPCVIAQLGQSLDGRIAILSGESRYINGPAALDHLHALRAVVDAVVVGVGTVVADDPLLNVRRINGLNPARVIIDPQGRMPAGARCLQGDGAAVYVISAAGAPRADGATCIAVPRQADGRIAPAAIIAALFARGLRRLLVEGGANTISAFIDAGCIDRLHLLVAPMILGSGKPGLALAPITSLSRALRPKTTLYPLSAGDVLFDCDLRSQHTAPDSGDEK